MNKAYSHFAGSCLVKFLRLEAESSRRFPFRRFWLMAGNSCWNNQENKKKEYYLKQKDLVLKDLDELRTDKSKLELSTFRKNNG